MFVPDPNGKVALSFFPSMSKQEFVDYYSLLGVAVESDIKVINKAYRQKALKYHPDKNKGDTEKSESFETD